MKKAMNPETYDKLILQHQGEVNKQGHIVLMNVGVGFYEMQVNLAKNTANSMLISIRKFLHGQEFILSIEPSSGTEDLGKYMMIVNNNNYSHASKKIEELLTYLYREKLTLPTMISSFEQFSTYPGMNGGPPVNETLRAKVVALDLEPA